MAAPKPAPAFKVDEIKILENRVVSFQLDAQLSSLTDAKQLTGFDFSIVTSQEIDIKKCVIRVRIEVVIQGALKGQDKRLPAGEIQTETVFHLKQLPKLMTQHEDSAPTLPNQIGGTMVGLAYSTTRGLLLSLSAGTLLSRAFLPVVNPVLLLTKSTAEVKA